MLSTVIEQLVSFGSKQFVVGAFLPVLVFGFLNGVVLYLESDRFRTWAGRLLKLEASFEGFAVLIAFAVVAYVLWGLAAFLAEVLEGRRLPAFWPFSQLASAEQTRLQTLRTNYFQARNERAGIVKRRPVWREKMSTDGEVGLAVDRNVYDPKTDAAGIAIEALRVKRRAAQNIGGDELAAAVTQLAAALKANDEQVPLADGSNPLDDDHLELLTLIDYAANRWGTQEVAHATELQLRFGPGEAAPTAFGNVAAALRGYGQTHYCMSLSTMWTRLQPLLKSDEPYLATLQSAKAQLDFSVLSCWLAMASTVVWTAVLPFAGTSPLRFAVVAAVGPILAWLAYLTAIENYVAFAEVVRAGVDLYRFRVLDALSLRRPATLRDERRLWEALRAATDFGQASIDMSYVEAKADTK